MNVVGHQAEAVHAVAETLDTLAQQSQEALAIVIVEEDLALFIAAPDDMVKSTGDMKAGFAGHGQQDSTRAGVE
jgi:hypothetical protein